jgi:beta-lactamase class A
MTSAWKPLGLLLVLAEMTQVGSAAVKSNHSKPPAKTKALAARPGPQAPTFIRDRLAELGRNFDGQVGIAVQSIDDGWEAGWKDRELYPQQSISKLWVAITAMDAVDRGRLNLDDEVTLTRSDLTLFHQPIRDDILNNGGSFTTTYRDLMYREIVTSDNTANDKLMRSVGGPKGVRAMIARKHLGAIRFDNGERDMQSRVAGLTWKPEYSIGNAFWVARDKVPLAIRSKAFNRYIANPYDGAAPSAIVNALARLKRGELLSRASTDHLLDVMSQTKTGPQRLKGGLADGWSLNHKTGTGQELGPEEAGYNDVGILTAPDGRSYAVAVMIKRTATPLPVRMTLMSNVTRAVIQQHDMDRSVAERR